MLYLHASYDQEFCDLWHYLRSKYPAELFNIDGVGEQLDIHHMSKEFFNSETTVADHSVDANANVCGKDVITYTFEVPKPQMKLNSYFNLWKTIKKLHGLETANTIIEMQFKGDIYINDVWDIGRPYCFNYSTYDIALEGLKMSNRLDVSRPKSLHSFIRQVEQFTVYAANSTLGATGLADLLLVASYFVDKMAQEDGSFADHHFKFADQEAAWTYVREQLTSLIYTLNWEFRGNQSPFTNVSVYDRKFLEELSPAYMIDGETPKIETIVNVQKLFLDCMNATLRRTPITFPVVTACFAIDDEKNLRDDEFLDMIAEKNLEYGFINIYCGKSSTLSSCCRLRSDMEGLGYSNTFGAGATKIGSLGVVTLNLPRIAVLSEGDEDRFMANLNTLVRVAATVNNAKREFIRDRIKRGSLPLYSLGLMDLKRQYSTCGITGLNEACELMGHDILTEDGQAFVLRCLKMVNATNDAMQNAYGAPHNVEQVPAENSSVKIAKKDSLLGYETGHPYYSNQFIPLITEADLLDRVALQGLFDEHFSGGAIMHVNVAERITDKERVKELIRYCASKGVVYWAINYTIQRCSLGHVTVGSDSFCTVCGQPVEEEFTRVVGFLTNTKNWNVVRRKHDWPHRQFYKEV